MKTIRLAIIGAVALSFASAIHSWAIEGLQLAVQSTNVVLSWPSATNETYIIQYDEALTNSWLTLTDDFPATLNTNLTIFVASNAVQPPIMTTNYSGGDTNGGGPLPPGGTNNSPGVFGSSAGFYRVVRDGVHIFGLTNGEVVSGDIQQPIEFAVQNTNDDPIVGVTFYDTNDNPLIGASCAPGPNGGWVLNWDTSMFPDGPDAIQAELDFADNPSVVSPPVTVTVSNLISFPNYLTQMFGSQMWIYAQTVPDSELEIDIYDENLNYLGSFYPVYSDGNGVVSFLWNLTDGNGNTFNDTNFFGYFTIFLNSPDVQSRTVSRPSLKMASSVSPPFMQLQTLSLSQLPRANVKKPAGIIAESAAPGSPGSDTNNSQWWSYEIPWTPNNNWVVAYGSLDGDADHNQIAQEMITGVAAGGGGENVNGILGTLQTFHCQVYPPGNQENLGSAFALQDATTRSNLLAALSSLNPLCENFFFWGHGNNDSIGGYPYFVTAIKQKDLAFALDNIPLSQAGPHVAYHVYRFVWNEACDTAAGTFSEAFGIPAQDLSTNNFIDGGVRSRAFLGYNKTIAFNVTDQTWQYESQMWSIFLNDFLEGNPSQTNSYSLAALVYAAQNNKGPFAVNISGDDYEMDSSATSLGATDLIYQSPW